VLRAGSKKKADSLPPLVETLVPAPHGDSLEIDEMWSFVTRKSNERWIWLVVSFQTRQVVAYAVGDRSEATCWRLWCEIPVMYRKKLVYTDFYATYLSVVPQWQHRPSRKGEGRTNTVERVNLTVRQRLGRLVRKTLSFSKSPRMHEKCLRFFLHVYNNYCITRFQLLAYT
jgi:IS1 family transposase